MSKTVFKCESYVNMGDFNIAVNVRGIKNDKLEKLYNLFDRVRLKHRNTWCTQHHKSAFDFISGNKTFFISKN